MGILAEKKVGCFVLYFFILESLPFNLTLKAFSSNLGLSGTHLLCLKQVRLDLQLIEIKEYSLSVRNLIKHLLIFYYHLQLNDFYFEMTKYFLFCSLNNLFQSQLCTKDFCFYCLQLTVKFYFILQVNSNVSLFSLFSNLSFWTWFLFFFRVTLIFLCQSNCF